MLFMKIFRGHKALDDGHWTHGIGQAPGSLITPYRALVSGQEATDKLIVKLWSKSKSQKTPKLNKSHTKKEKRRI